MHQYYRAFNEEQVTCFSIEIVFSIHIEPENVGVAWLGVIQFWLAIMPHYPLIYRLWKQLWITSKIIEQSKASILQTFKFKFEFEEKIKIRLQIVLEIILELSVYIFKHYLNSSITVAKTTVTFNTNSVKPTLLLMSSIQL